MTQKLKGFLAIASFPIGMMICLGVFVIGWHFFGLPSFQEYLDYAREMYGTHGYWIILIASLLEGTLLLNWYFPGSVVMVMGTILAIEGSKSLLITMLIVIGALCFTSMLNYGLGKYGWYKLLLKFGLRREIEKMQHRLEKHGLKMLIVSYVHPQISSLAATSAGILQYPFRTFFLYTSIAVVFWASVWVGTAYLIGPSFIDVLHFKNLFIIMGCWIAILGLQYLWKHRHGLEPIISSSETAPTESATVTEPLK